MQFETSDGVRLHFTDEGSGLPLLALSGLTRNGTDFDYVAPHLPAVRLIRLDYRGRGRSAWADPATYIVPREAQDVLELLDHLRLTKAAILGTSRGGLIAMLLAAVAKPRLAGVALVDIGPVIAPEGLAAIRGYVGLPPAARSHAEAVEMRASLLSGFAGVPRSRWEEEVRKHYRETPAGLAINYDPRLREAVLATVAPPGDPWLLFEALAGLPLALIRGANSDLLAPETADEMRRRRPDTTFAAVPDRGHVPFLDEPEAVAALKLWIDQMKGEPWTSA